MGIDTSTALPAVTLEEAKQHLRIDYSDEDTLITSLIIAATQMAEHEIQRPIITRESNTGFGDTSADVPASVRQWILLHIGAMFENREFATDRQIEPINTFSRLLDPYRTWA